MCESNREFWVEKDDNFAANCGFLLKSENDFSGDLKILINQLPPTSQHGAAQQYCRLVE